MSWLGIIKEHYKGDLTILQRFSKKKQHLLHLQRKVNKSMEINSFLVDNLKIILGKDNIIIIKDKLEKWLLFYLFFSLSAE